jgi:vitamin B12 transporter
MKLKKFLAFGCAALLFSSTSYALETQDGTIVVTATRNSAKIAKTPSRVDVITAKQLKDDGIIFIKDALKDIAGVSVNSNGAFGGIANVDVRGLPSYYTKILIDGVDVSDPSLTQPFYNLANLTVNDIQRIEIVQGAQSGLYGSNAIGGVINIITKKGSKKPYFKYKQTAGSYNTFSETVQSGGKVKKTGFFIDISQFDTHGISKMDKLNPNGTYSRGDENDGYHKTSISTRLEYSFDDDFKIGEIAKWYKTRDYLDNGWSASYSPDDSADSNQTEQSKNLRTKNQFFMTKIYADKKFKNLTANFNVFYVRTARYNIFAPSSWLNYKGKRAGANINAIYTINNTKLTVGSSYVKEKYEDDSPFEKTRNNISGYIEAEQKITNLTLQAAAREDHFSTFGNHFTYKLGANYFIGKTGTILKVNYSTGFRAPSIYELYAKPIPDWGFLGGNTNLRSEKARTWDFGFLQSFRENKYSLSATIFKSIIKDKIDYVTNTATWESTYENTPGKTIAYGVELGAKAKLVNQIVIGANYTYTKSKNPKTGRQTARIPLRVYTGYITFSTPDNKILATLNGRYIGTRFDDDANVHQTGKYAVFDFTTLYKPTKNIEASLSIKNIFNKFYEEVYGYSTLPRSVFAKISYKF